MAYAIGVAQPVSHPRRDVRHRARSTTSKIDAGRPRGVRPPPGGDHPRPRPARPIYRKTAAYGHFGRAAPEFTWEQRQPARRLQGAPSACDLERRRAMARAAARRPGRPRRHRARQAVRLPRPRRARATRCASGSMVRVAAARPPGRRLGRRARPARRTVPVDRLRADRQVVGHRPVGRAHRPRRWASRRWGAGRLRPFLVAASPPTDGRLCRRRPRRLVDGRRRCGDRRCRGWCALPPTADQLAIVVAALASRSGRW